MSDRFWRRAFRLETGPKRVERDVNQEIAFHLEMRTRKLVAAGFTPDAARAAALADFGDIPGIRNECLSIGRDRERAMKISDLWTNARQDVAYAVRSLRKQPAFTAVVLLILAIGIGANTATFALIDALMLRPLPVPHAEQLVTVGDPSQTGSMSSGTPSTDVVSYPAFADVRDHVTTLSGLYASAGTSSLDVRVAPSAPDPAVTHPRARYVSGNFFAVLQVHAAMGRTFGEAEDVAGGSPVVVISHAYWQRELDGEQSVIGRQISINGVMLIIVGVTPEGFTGDVIGASTDLWIPLLMQPQVTRYANWVDDRNVSWLLMMGRLKPGVTLAQARGEVSSLELHSILDHAAPDDRPIVEASVRETQIRIEPGARGFSYYRSTYARALVILMAAVVLVVLVVCANVANLMLARSAARSREISVRMALGAGRSRLVRQLLTECLVLGAAAGALGLLVATWAVRMLLRIASQGPTPIPLDAHIDGRMMAYTGAVSLITMAIFGVLPALRATRLDLATTLRGQGRALNALGSHTGGFGIGKWLVALQVALSTVLLIGTGMLVHSARQMATVNLGMDRDNLAVVSVEARKAGYSGPRLEALMRDLVARVERVPGVTAVTYSKNGLFSGSEGATGIRVPGYEIRVDSEKYVTFDAVGPGYFHAIGAQLLRGRDLSDADRRGAARVAVINETAARFYFGDTNPISRSFTRHDTAFTIVGVVRDVEEQDVRAAPVRRAYFTMSQLAGSDGSYVLEVRTTGNPSNSAKPIREAVLAVDRALTPEVDPVNSLIRQSTAQDWLVVQIVTFFGALALVLAALGLYGVMAYSTTRRTGEFGIRAALGAAPGAVTRMILREALTLTALGVAIGLPAGLAAARLTRGQLFDVQLVDPISLITAVVVLVATAAVASYLPARRAARVGPLEALRAE
ncbi:MAG TPA: ABC transporter permease [Gemmatimonadaceae bacterium]|jgi:predicted permease